MKTSPTLLFLLSPPNASTSLPFPPTTTHPTPRQTKSETSASRDPQPLSPHDGVWPSGTRKVPGLTPRGRHYALSGVACVSAGRSCALFFFFSLCLFEHLEFALAFAGRSQALLDLLSEVDGVDAVEAGGVGAVAVDDPVRGCAGFGGVMG